MIRNPTTQRSVPPVALCALLTAMILIPSLASGAQKTHERQADVAPLLSPAQYKKQARWRRAIAATPQPAKGCFTARYPSLSWQPVGCVDAPGYPMPPRAGLVPQIVGNGNDVAAQAPSGVISAATGSFDSLTNVTGESGPIGNTGTSHADTYTLQVNTDFFSTTACAASPNTTGCRGWEQFVFENNPSDHRAFIQYWLIDYDATCPANFQPFPVAGGHTDCVQLSNLSGAVPTTAVPVTNLGQVTLTGVATTGADSVTVTIGGTAFSRAGDNSVNASSGWRTAEFNILGDGGNAAGGGTATFNTGAAIVTRTRITHSGQGPPNCVANGFTGELNNLSFGPLPPPAGSQPGPAVIFNQSTTGGAPSACAAATTVGDAHLTTLSGLLYDFQATGDFEMLRSASGLLVQARQVSGAPTWPDASVNAAVAARVGKRRFAVCLSPQRVLADGRALQLGPGQAAVFADGSQVVRRGNAYVIRGASGDWVKADVNGTYIDVSVGLGRWPVEVHGLLANAGNDPDQLETRSGAVLRGPYSFGEFYSRYGESWRVKPSQSMLRPCGAVKETGRPAKPFHAGDLARPTAVRARRICARAGVEDPALLDACTIDVAFSRRAAAAKIYSTTRPPVAVAVIR